MDLDRDNEEREGYSYPNPGAGLLGCLLCSLPTQTEIDGAATDDQGCSMNQHSHACA